MPSRIKPAKLAFAFLSFTLFATYMGACPHSLMRIRSQFCQVGMQNASLGVVLATKHFASPLTPLPCAISAIMMNVMGSGLAVIWRQQGPLKDDAAQTSELDELSKP
jgi:predicted Na+-dependent transporter